MGDWIAKFRGWKDASLLRRVMVTVAGFVMLTCVSILGMSVVAVAATRAVFKPAASAGASASGKATAEVASEGARPPSSPPALKKGGAGRSAKPKTDLDSAGDNE